jgi:hypothetical protein
MMKIVFSILMCTVIAQFARGQNDDKILRKLVENGLLEQKQVKGFVGHLEKSDEHTNASFIKALFQEEYKKITGEYYFPLTYLNFEKDETNQTEKEKRNSSLKEYLDKIKSCGLINDQQYLNQTQKITNNEYMHLVYLLAGIKSELDHDEYMNPEGLKSFAEQLKTHQIVGNGYDALVSNIENGKLENPIQFLNYCKNAVVIRVQDFAQEPELYLEDIHKRTASLIPELSFSDFTFQIVEDSSFGSDTKSYDFLVSLKANGKYYKQKSFYRLYSTEKKEYFGIKIDQQEYYKIFNKVLSDLHSPLRLHEVKGMMEIRFLMRNLGLLHSRKSRLVFYTRAAFIFLLATKASSKA